MDKSFDEISINKIYNEDCLETMKRMPDGFIDLIVTDPPYLIQYKTGRRKNKDHEFCSEIEGSNNPQLVKDYIAECHRIMKQDTAMYMFCSFDKVDFFKQQLENYFTIKNMIIWVKNSHTAGDLKAQFGKQYEILFLVNKGRKQFNGKRITDIWEFKRVAGDAQLHQNEKPVSLLMRCIDKHSNKGDIIFDGFMGSGSTAIACLRTERQYVGSEVEQKYINIINKRIDNEVKQSTLF